MDSIDLWEVHKAECGNCGSEFLVTDDPRPGVADTVKCPRCGTAYQVGKICGPYRSDVSPQELETVLVSINY